MPTSKLLPFQRARRPAQIAKSAWPSRTSTATSRAANIFPLSCCNDWPPSSSSGSICPSKSLRAEAAWPRSPESPCLFFSPPRLGVQQLRHEDILAGQPALGKTLLEVVAQESVERLAIGFDAIGPPIVGQQLAIFFNERTEPRDHGVYIVEGQALIIVVHGGVLGRAEAAINRFRETGILQSKVFAHDDAMHDRKDAGTLVGIAFHRPVVRKKTRYLRRVLEDAIRHIGPKSRHRFRHLPAFDPGLDRARRSLLRRWPDGVGGRSQPASWENRSGPRSIGTVQAEVTAGGLKALRRAFPIAIKIQRRMFGEEGCVGGSLLTALLRIDRLRED